jgi:peptidoglycan-associated lipoprotein
MGQHPGWKVRIEGNCDERGSTEYNLTLGEERANAAKQALTQAGVSGDRLQIISYGKEKPVCTEANEDCWQKNRHDHFVLLH